MNTNDKGGSASTGHLGQATDGTGSNLGQQISRPQDSSSSNSVQPIHQQYQPLGGSINTYDHSRNQNVAPVSAVHAFETQNYQNYNLQQQPLPPQQQPLAQNYINHSHVTSQSPDNGGFDQSIFKQTGMSPNDEPSHGTLVISASGRSKYLGPSAASEWLKDVSHLEPEFRIPKETR